MIKKILYIFICVMLLSTSVFADENQALQKDDTKNQATEYKTNTKRQKGNGNFQIPEGNFNVQEGDFQMPGGNFPIPEGDIQMPEGNFQFPAGDFQMPENAEGRSMFGQGGFHPGGFSGDRMNMQNNPGMNSESFGFTAFLKEYTTPVISIILLALAFVFVIFYKRKNY